MGTERSLIGRFGIIAEGQFLVCGEDTEALHELGGAEGGTPELETDSLESTGIVKTVETAAIDERAAFKGTVDEFGIINCHFNAAEILALDSRHALPFSVYRFSGQFASTLKS
jgi:hypothetical protein